MYNDWGLAQKRQMKRFKLSLIGFLDVDFGGAITCNWFKYKLNVLVHFLIYIIVLNSII